MPFVGIQLQKALIDINLKFQLDFLSITFINILVKRKPRIVNFSKITERRKQQKRNLKALNIDLGEVSK